MAGRCRVQNKSEQEYCRKNKLQGQCDHRLTIRAAERQNDAPLAFLAAYSSYSASRKWRCAAAIANSRGSCRSKGVPEMPQPLPFIAKSQSGCHPVWYPGWRVLEKNSRPRRSNIGDHREKHRLPEVNGSFSMDNLRRCNIPRLIWLQTIK